MTPLLSAFTLHAIHAYQHYKSLSRDAAMVAPATPPVVRREVAQFLDGVDVQDSTWDAWADTMAEYAMAA